MSKRTTALTAICCWVYGDDDKDVFTIQIAQSAMVSVLKGSIGKKIPKFNHVVAKDLRLYAVPGLPLSMPLDEQTQLDSQTAVNAIGGFPNCVIVVDGPRPPGLGAKSFHHYVAVLTSLSQSLSTTGCMVINPIRLSLSKFSRTTPLKK